MKRQKKTILSKFGIILLILIITIPASKVAAENYFTLKEEKYDSLLVVFLDQLYLQKYSDAELTLKSSIPENFSGYLYFNGLFNCTVYNDLGDTAALAKAKRSWETLHLELKKKSKSSSFSSESEKKEALYFGLTLLQLSYVSTIYGKLLPAALHARDGMKILKKVPEYIEAQCASQTHEYYKKNLMKVFSWLPFVDTDRTKPRKFLENHYHKSRYLSPIFLTPLIWMKFDNGLYHEGLDLTRNFLKKYPDNRIFRLIEADFLYKLKEYEKAAAIFETIKLEYHQMYSHPSRDHFIQIGYLSAVGNLVRIYHDTKNKDGYIKNATIWFSKETKNNRKWLPKSLIKDLKRFEGKGY